MITLETTINGTEKTLTYYSKETIDTLYEKYAEYKDTFPEYTQSMKEFIETTYTDEDCNGGEILIPTFSVVEDITLYEYKNHGITSREENTIEDQMTYTTINYDVVAARYGTPVEFLIDILEITGSQDFVNAFIAEVTKPEYKITIGLYDLTTTTVNVEQELYTQSTTIEGSAWNTSQNTVINERYTFKKQDDSDVNVTKIEIITENGYDMQVKEVKCWWADMVINNEISVQVDLSDGIDKSTVEQYAITQLLNGANVEDVTETLLKSVTENSIIKDDEEFTNNNNPGIFIDNNQKNSDNGKEGFLNCIYNYIKDKKNVIYGSNTGMTEKEIKEDLENLGITENYNKMSLSFSDSKQKVATIIQRQSVTYGIPSGEYNLDGVLALLKDSDGKPVEYRDIYDRNNSDNSKTKPGELLVNGDEMLFQLLDSSENTEGLSDVMKYLLQLYSGKDYGITSSIFTDYSLSNIYMGSSDLLREYIFYWESSYKPATNADGTKYIISYDPVGNLAVGNGLDIYNRWIRTII